MPYISLYRKYRSQTFDDVVGQDHVVRTIRNSIRAGRIGQGYLFCGSRGTGKTTVARLIAKALNCMESDGPTPDPCGRCEACVSITEGSAVDVIEMDAASNRGVDDVDLLREGVKYPPMRLRYKVYIIDEAHQLSPQAKDAFLKTLEEPPPHAVFILATTESHKIPVTIRSRCQQFDFRRGSADEIAGRLRYVTEIEKVTIDDDAVDLIARSASGSYRDSLSLLEQVMAYTEDSITSKDVYTVLGTVDEDVLFELGEVLSSSDSAAAFSLADRLLREGKDVRELLRSAANHFRDLLALKVGADSHHRNDERWRSQTEKFSQERLLGIINTFAAAEKDLRWNEQHRLALEMALLKAQAESGERRAEEVTGYRSQVTGGREQGVGNREQETRSPLAGESLAPPSPLAGEGRGEGDIRPPPARQPEPQRPPREVAAPEAPEPASAPPRDPGKPVTLEDIQREWKSVLYHLQRVMKQVNIAATAREGNPIDLTNYVLSIGFNKNREFHRSATQQGAERIAQAISDVMGARLKVRAVVADEPPVAVEPPEIKAEPANEEPADHPSTKDVVMIFDGKEVPAGDDPWEEEQG